MAHNECIITLRPLTKRDGEYLDQISDEAAFHFSRDPSEAVPTGMEPILWDSSNRRIQRLSFAILADDRLVGEVSLSGIDLDERIAAVTMGIAQKASRCRGIGSAALRQILTYAFYSLGLEKVTAATISTNLPALRSLEHGGFKLTGIERFPVQTGRQQAERLHFTITLDQFNDLAKPTDP